VFVRGCHGASKEVEIDSSKDLEKLADGACACKDAACGERVLDQYVEYLKKHPEMPGDLDKSMAAGKRLGECVIASGVPNKTFNEKLTALEKSLESLK
jgi:hypothetical protein